MIERGFWQHLPTGNIWAVETDNHVPVRCAGPLSARDVDHLLLRYLDYTTTYLRLLQAEWSSYAPYELCSVCGTVLRPGAPTTSNVGDGRVHLSCSIKPPPIQGGSVGAAVRVETLWQRSARLACLSAALRRNSERLQERCRSVRVSAPCPWGMRC